MQLFIVNIIKINTFHDFIFHLKVIYLIFVVACSSSPCLSSSVEGQQWAWCIWQDWLWKIQMFRKYRYWFKTKKSVFLLHKRFFSLRWDRKNNPEPWNKLEHNQQYKVWKYYFPVISLSWVCYLDSKSRSPSDCVCVSAALCSQHGLHQTEERQARFLSVWCRRQDFFWQRYVRLQKKKQNLTPLMVLVWEFKKKTKGRGKYLYLALNKQASSCLPEWIIYVFFPFCVVSY